MLVLASFCVDYFLLYTYMLSLMEREADYELCNRTYSIAPQKLSS